MSKAGYYKWRKSYSHVALRRQKDAWQKEHILSIHRKHLYYGYKCRICALACEGILMNQKCVRCLMYELGIRSVTQWKKSIFFVLKSSKAGILCG